MNLNSPLFDSIRIRPSCDEPQRDVREPTCERVGCTGAGVHRAPKGRGRERQYWRFCLDHVREYNASYNYFAGMSDDAVAAYQKDAVVGHRPTWSMGVNGSKRPDGADGPARDWAYADPLGVLRAEGLGQTRRERPAEPRRPRYGALVMKALDILGLDETADGPAIKAQYKALVKRFHPDAHGGDRSYEERLRDIIHAHDTLKAAGLC
jgi:DnaJ domain